jgi:hypothetical protein
MATGWNVYTAIVTPGDVTGDGNADILARTTAGALLLYPGNGTGGLSAAAPSQIGSGWQTMTALTSTADMTGEGRPDLLARDSAGRLWLYPMGAGATFQTRRLIGGGWAAMTAIQGPGDVTGDKQADILARDGAGQLWAYQGNGTGQVTTRTLVGSGWAPMTALVTPGNWDSAGGNDVLGRDSAGRLWLYPGNNAAFRSRHQVGSGWQGMSVIG